MIEVFKTNVQHRAHANLLIKEIRSYFENYEVTFDLEDCDKIMRVCCSNGAVHCPSVIDLVTKFGFEAEELLDFVPSQY